MPSNAVSTRDWSSNASVEHGERRIGAAGGAGGGRPTRLRPAIGGDLSLHRRQRRGHRAERRGLPERQPSAATRDRDRASAAYATSATGYTRRTGPRSEEHTSELQSLMRISYAVLCLNKQN